MKLHFTTLHSRYARIYNIGFETNSLTNGIEANSLTTTNNGGLSIVGTTVRTGSFSLQVAANASGDQIQIKNSNSHSQYIRIYMNISSLPGSSTDFLVFADASGGIADCFLTLTATGTLQLWYSNTGGGFTQQGSDSSALGTGSWNMIDLHIDDTGGTASVVIEARLNGSVFATGTVSLFATGNTGVPNGFTSIGDGLVNHASSTGTWFVDDVAINDSSGANQTSYAGSGKILCLLPNAAGDVNTFATQTGGTAGAANNFTRVDEVTPDDATSFNGSSTLNQEDLFNVANSGIGASDTVNVVQVIGRYRNSTADATGAFKFEVEKAASGTKAQSASIVPNSTTWVTATPANSIVEYTDPDGSAWTQATLDTAQIGYKETTAPGTAGRRCDITQVRMLVDYTPASGAQYYSFLTTLGAM